MQRLARDAHWFTSLIAQTFCKEKWNFYIKDSQNDSNYNMTNATLSVI